jgi:cell division protein FtsQ
MDLESNDGAKLMNTASLNSVKNKAPSPSLGEMLWPWFLNTMKTMVSGLMAIVVFIVAPIWNSEERMKKLTHFFMFAFLGLILLWVLFWIGQRPVFTIRQIQIQSATEKNLQHMNPALVKSNVLSQLSGNFFSIRLNDTRKIFEDLPWVRKASVRRVWPNSLVISVEEYEPVGNWMSSEGPQLIDQHGELFTVNLAEADLHQNLVDFSGPPNSNKDVMELYLQLNEWFTPLNTKIKTLNLSSRYSWTAKLDNGMTFELGRDLDQKDRSQLKARIDRFLKVWPQVKEKFPNKIDYVDLRYTNGFAVRAGGKLDTSKRQEVLSSALVEELPTQLATAKLKEKSPDFIESSVMKPKKEFKKLSFKDKEQQR